MKRHKFQWTAVVGVASIALLASACGSGSDGSDSGSTGKTIGILQLVQSDEASARAVAAMEKQAKELGYKTTVIDANYDPSKELAGMDTLINQKVAAIVTQSVDNDLLKSKFAAAKSAGIPVVAVNGGAIQPGIDLGINIPEKEGGVETAEAFFKKVVAQRGDGPSTIVEMVLPEASPCRLRAQGFDEVAAKYPNIKVVKYKIDGTNASSAAFSYANQYLSANKDTAGILSCWDVPMMGALKAVEQVKPSKFTMMGINGTSDAVAAMQNGNDYVSGVLAFALAKAGYDAVIAADALVKGEPVDKPDGGIRDIPIALFTPDSVPEAPSLELPDWLPEGWSGDYWK